MGHHVTKWLLPIISFGVAMFIIFFLITINSGDNINIDVPVAKEESTANEIKKDKSVWIERFAQNEREGYFYPVNEIYIELGLDKTIEYSKIYRLSASLKDPYQLFCLKQELKQHKLLYYLNKDRDGAELLIFSKDQKRLQSLLNSLKNYQIVAKIEPYKED